MSTGKWFLSAALVLSSGSFLLTAAADEPKAPTTQPMHAKKLVEPWSLLKTLTPDQTAQIEKIHADALEQTKKIDAKEEDDITALLTPDQVTELAAAKEKITAERKAKMSKKKMAATEPTK